MSIKQDLSFAWIHYTVKKIAYEINGLKLTIFCSRVPLSSCNAFIRRIAFIVSCFIPLTLYIHIDPLISPCPPTPSPSFSLLEPLHTSSSLLKPSPFSLKPQSSFYHPPSRNPPPPSLNPYPSFLESLHPHHSSLNPPHFSLKPSTLLISP